MFVKIFNKIVNYKIRQNIDLILIFSFTCGVYIYNLSPSVFGGDSGDFLSAIAVKGVPHPSGYPLYTILGLFFNSLPIRATIAWKVGLISTILSSLAVVFLYMIVEELTNHKSIALISSLTLAFIQPFWIYAEVTEVFALHSLFVITITYFSIRFYKTKKNKYLYTLSFLSGLSLTNNLTILLIFPAVSILVLATKPRMFLDF
ncbi:MAG: DUF2723 domain-containing protein, partial [Thermoplasmatales archaeon]